MDPQRHQQISDLFLRACELDSEERAAFLEQACAGDPELRAEVESLLANEEEARRLLETGRGAVEASAFVTTRFSDDEADAQPERIGAFKILQTIGEGGMGIVYLAEQEKPVRRQVALKLIKTGMDTRQVVARFESERQALAMMNHPGIARVYDGGATDQGRPYFAMEYVPGEPITTYCDRHRLETRERLELFRRVCDGVQHAHQKGIIHRDIKPSNVLVAVQDGKPAPKIIDFGVAKATQQRLTERTMFTQVGALIGTPEYMSPEQAEMTGLDIDTRTDVYSLGVLLYELLVGALPFDPQELRRAGFDEICRRIRESEPSRPSTRISTLGDTATDSARNRRTDPGTLARRLRGDLDWITMKAMDKDRTRRYASPSELATDVRRHLDHEPVMAGAPSTLYRMGKFVRRHKVGVLATGFALAALLVGLAGTTYGLVRATRAEAEVRQEAATAKQVSDFMVGLFQVSDPRRARGDTITAREILDRGVEQIEESLEDQPRVRARLMGTMGHVYMTLGLYEQSRPLQEQSVARHRELLGDEHPETLEFMHSLALLYSRQGLYREAEQLHLEALEIRRRTLGEDAPKTLLSMSNLALLYVRQGRYNDAEPLYREALEIQRRTLGDDATDVLDSMNGLAELYRELGRYDEAEPLYLEGLERARRVLGDDHRGTLALLSNLGLLYWSLGRYDETEPLYVEALETKRRVLGNDHPDTLTTLINLGLLYWNQKRYEEAESVYVEGLEATERVLGQDHPNTLNIMGNLGLLYGSQKRYEEAVRVLGEAVARVRRVFPREHLLKGWIIKIHGESLLGLKRFDDAQASLLEAHEILVAAVGADHRHTQDAIAWIAELYRAWGKPAEESEWRAKLVDTDPSG